MAENNRVDVKIYGRQYTIKGTSSNKDIERIANYVDDLMNQLAKNLPSLSTLSLAVLAAVNIASDLSEAVRVNQSQAGQIKKMKEDSERYAQLWEDAKASLIKYQEDTKNGVEQLQELQRIFNMKNAELSQVKEALEQMTAKYEEAEKQLQEASAETGGTKKRQSSDGKNTEKVKKLEEEKQALQEKVEELEEQLKKTKGGESKKSQGSSNLREKYKELENSFFDIQMENIMLKNEIDELRNKQ